jgi:hypothetical protein
LIASLRKVGTAALTLFALAGGTSAQTIRYEEGGRQQTYDFTSGQQASTREGANARKRERSTRPTRGDLPRGPKNIPWDEPGKISGVPGVLENSATSLPEKSSLRRARRKENRGPKVLTGSETEHKLQARQEPPPQPPDASAKAPSHGPGQKDFGEPGGRPTALTSNAQTDTARAEDHNAETRAKLIEKPRASAWAEEQRRLEAEKSRDRHAPSSVPRPTNESTKEAGRATRIQPDPDHTGAVTAAQDTARPERSGWMRGACRMLFFGALPGC